MKRLSMLLLLPVVFVTLVTPAIGYQTDNIIRSVHLDPLDFNAATGLTIEPVLADDAADYAFEYRWILNGEEVEFETSNVFPGELLRRGDELSVEINSIDPSGEKMEPGTILVMQAANASPTIHSEPPDRFSGAGFQYQVDSSDPDGDSLSYRLEGAPEGMQIDTSGNMTWSYESLPEGSFAVLIVIEDAYGGRAEQSLDLDLSFISEEKGTNE